jgi:hypothetical protein
VGSPPGGALLARLEVTLLGRVSCNRYMMRFRSWCGQGPDRPDPVGPWRLPKMDCLAPRHTQAGPCPPGTGADGYQGRCWSGVGTLPPGCSRWGPGGDHRANCVAGSSAVSVDTAGLPLPAGSAAEGHRQPGQPRPHRPSWLPLPRTHGLVHKRVTARCRFCAGFCANPPHPPQAWRPRS